MKQPNSDQRWIERSMPLGLQARALRPTLQVGKLSGAQLAAAFTVAWSRGCETQIELLFTALWKRPRSYAIPRRTVAAIYGELIAGPFKLQSVRAIKEKHVRWLLDQWKARGIAQTTERKRLLELRDFLEWIQKRQVVDNVMRARTVPPRVATAEWCVNLT